MDTPAPAAQHAWRAPCPHCGAPVELRSAASACAVCSHCRSALVREGEALRRIDRVAAPLDDASPLHLGAAGRYQGQAFTLVGRLQYHCHEGGWNEWHALFDSGRTGWLVEGGGQHVLAFETPLRETAPGATLLTPDRWLPLDGQAWQVAAKTRAALQGAEGELPWLPRLLGEFAVVELHNAQGEVGTLNYGHRTEPQWALCRAVTLAELGMAGLTEPASKTFRPRAFLCPGCGAPLKVTRATTKSLGCSRCGAVIDVSQGVGSELAHDRPSHAGEGGLEPLLPLGRTGTLTLGGLTLLWQVVGCLERCEQPRHREDEPSFWREYLLHHPGEGFAVLVDAEDGWSWRRPAAGTPRVHGTLLQHQGLNYRKRRDCQALTPRVLGEIPWRIGQDRAVRHIDYQGLGANASKRLSYQQTDDGEIAWWAGETLDAATLTRAFGLTPSTLGHDVAPTAGSTRSGLPWPLHLFWMGMLLWLLMAQFDTVRHRDNLATASPAPPPSIRCQTYQSEVEYWTDRHRQCVAAPALEEVGCGVLQENLNTAAADHQRCLDGNAPRSGTSSSGWSTSSGGYGGGHK